jgi:hypothetical protein
VSKLLLRHGWTWSGGKKMWGQGHRLWLRSLRFEHKEDQWVLDDYLLALAHVEERLRALDAQIEEGDARANPRASSPSRTGPCAVCTAGSTACSSVARPDPRSPWPSPASSPDFARVGEAKPPCRKAATRILWIVPAFIRRLRAPSKARGWVLVSRTRVYAAWLR